jgi:adenylate cyclase
LRAPHENRELLRDLLQGALAQGYQALQVRQTLEDSSLLTSDLDRVLALSQLEGISFEDLLKHFLQLLRAHVWVEKCSMFGIYDGFTLEGLAGVGGGPDQQNWKINFSTVAGMAATTRRPYHTENPATDPNFQTREGGYIPRNLLCYPLLHGPTLVGVLNLSNRIGGEFSPADKAVVERFASVGAHILQKHYFKQRMQTYERTSDHLGKYLSSKVVKNVKARGAMELGGAEKKVVCLFADIRGYTTISQGLSPAILVQLLNFHFERMHAIIEKHEGTLDKIVGDLIMAVWNIPNDQPDPELLAMRTALEMQKEITRVISPEWAKQGIVKMGMGIGVNSGMAVVGNLGSSRFMNYTVIGDTINTAQRLESKAGAGEIWMEESLFPYVHGKIEKPLRKESDIKLKGKSETIDAYVYRPLGY